MRLFIIIISLLSLISSPPNARSAEKPVPDIGERLTVSCEFDDLKVKVKRCDCSENGTVIIIFTLENTGNTSIQRPFESSTSQVYDDEGNVYSGKDLSFAYFNGNFSGSNCYVNLLNGITTKFRMKIKNVDPAASMFKLVKIRFYSEEEAIIIKNLPITREGD